MSEEKILFLYKILKNLTHVCRFTSIVSDKINNKYNVVFNITQTIP